MSGNKANSPSAGNDTRNTFPDLPIRNAIAAATLSAGLVLSGSPAIAATTTQMNEVRNTCIAETKAKKESLLKLVETKRAAGEMEKVAKLEGTFNKLVDLCVEGVVLDAKKTELDAKKTELDAKKTELDAKKTELDAKKTELDAKKTELDALDKAGAMISAELGQKIRMVDDFSSGKITREQYQKDLEQLPQIIERAYAWLASARKVTTNSQSIAHLDAMEKSIGKLSQRTTSYSTQK